MIRPQIIKGPFLLDGQTAYRAICPGCGIDAILDDDQYHGRISIQCQCGYHETHDLAQPSLEAAPQRIVIGTHGLTTEKRPKE